ncbi:MAG: Glu/Leu/Phe/Val dehydrogenase [Planctomycetota bacterium]|nr:MAG: Glu/Leu/Phe/Val dehydrogenase [Planctomycetota bacterium]
MEITKISVPGYEEVVRAVDQSIDFHAIIAIHDTTLGPALGGCRLWNYATEDEALQDVLRLAKGMTYKAACAGLALGGGKSVIIGNKRDEAIFLAMGEFVESLGGRYITAEDVGTSVEDMKIIAQKTKYVTGLPREMGSSGDPSPFTAKGVFEGMKACLEEVYGNHDFQGKVVALQGVGHVGSYLAGHLHEAGAKLVICDMDSKKVEEVANKYNAQVVELDKIYDADCHIFAPCALGAVINDETIPRLKCKIVAGPANNQLLRPEHAKKLQERGILYAPDYVLNAGGLINVYTELEPGGYDEKRAMERVNHIYDAIKNIIQLAKKEGICTEEASERFAHSILEKAKAEKQKSQS